MTNETNNQNQNSWSKWLRGEVLAAFAIGSTVAGLVIYVNTPISALNTNVAVVQNTISQIKNNDLTHIELEITSINQRLDDMQKEQNNLQNQMTEVLTILKQNK